MHKSIAVWAVALSIFSGPTARARGRRDIVAVRVGAEVMAEEPAGIVTGAVTVRPWKRLVLEAVAGLGAKQEITAGARLGIDLPLGGLDATHWARAVFLGGYRLLILHPSASLGISTAPYFCHLLELLVAFEGNVWLSRDLSLVGRLYLGALFGSDPMESAPFAGQGIAPEGGVSVGVAL